ncbi:MAG: hypothetical protein LBE44_01350 [Microbacterium hominis]|nr:hypothetical protein [Microbacterium hominis]
MAVTVIVVVIVSRTVDRGFEARRRRKRRGVEKGAFALDWALALANIGAPLRKFRIAVFVLLRFSASS